MKLFKSIFLFLITLSADIFVCYNKAANLNNVYANNFIKIYFLYTIATTFVLIIAVFALSVYEKKPASFKVTSSQPSIIKTAELSKKWFSKMSDIISFLVVITFGIFGCWWFFSIALIKGFFSWYLQNQVKNIAEKLIKENPELKPKEEKKVRLKSKFKFIKSV